MSRTGWYWLFFVIVAVGLALSWGQVGRKTHRVLQEGPIVYLQTEGDCRPRRVPCAALGEDRALIVGPGGSGLLVRKTGLDAGEITSAEFSLLAADGMVLGRRTLMVNAEVWHLGDIPAPTRMLRLQISGRGETTVAEFPLDNR